MNQIEIINEDGEAILLEEAEFNSDYEPTEEEVYEYAKYLGMNPLIDQEFFHIAYQGLKAPLPEYWKACKNQEGLTFYINMQTQEAIQEHPLDEYFKKLFQDEKANKFESKQKSKKIEKKPSKFLNQRPPPALAMELSLNKIQESQSILKNSEIFYEQQPGITAGMQLNYSEHFDSGSYSSNLQQSQYDAFEQELQQKYETHLMKLKDSVIIENAKLHRERNNITKNQSKIINESLANLTKSLYLKKEEVVSYKNKLNELKEKIEKQINEQCKKGIKEFKKEIQMKEQSFETNENELLISKIEKCQNKQKNIISQKSESYKNLKLIKMRSYLDEFQQNKLQEYGEQLKKFEIRLRKDQVMELEQQKEDFDYEIKNFQQIRKHKMQENKDKEEAIKKKLEEQMKQRVKDFETSLELRLKKSLLDIREEQQSLRDQKLQYDHQQNIKTINKQFQAKSQKLIDNIKSQSEEHEVYLFEKHDKELNDHMIEVHQNNDSQKNEMHQQDLIQLIQINQDKLKKIRLQNHKSDKQRQELQKQLNQLKQQIKLSQSQKKNKQQEIYEMEQQQLIKDRNNQQLQQQFIDSNQQQQYLQQQQLQQQQQVQQQLELQYPFQQQLQLLQHQQQYQIQLNSINKSNQKQINFDDRQVLQEVQPQQQMQSKQQMEQMKVFKCDGLSLRSMIRQVNQSRKKEYEQIDEKQIKQFEKLFKQLNDDLILEQIKLQSEDQQLNRQRENLLNDLKHLQQKQLEYQELLKKCSQSEISESKQHLIAKISFDLDRQNDDIEDRFQLTEKKVMEVKQKIEKFEKIQFLADDLQNKKTYDLEHLNSLVTQLQKASQNEFNFIMKSITSPKFQKIPVFLKSNSELKLKNIELAKSLITQSSNKKIGDDMISTMSQSTKFFKFETEQKQDISSPKQFIFKDQSQKARLKNSQENYKLVQTGSSFFFNGNQKSQKNFFQSSSQNFYKNYFVNKNTPVKLTLN